MGGFVLATAVAAAEDDDHRAFTILLGDAYFAAQTVVVDLADLQDVFAAGEDVTLSSPTAGNAHLAGRYVDVSAPVGGSLYTAGNRITIGADIAGRLYAGGETVTIGDAAVIARGARIGARRIKMDGTVRQSAAFAGRRVEVNGMIDGDAVITAEELVISSDARVTGTFTYHAPEEIEIPASFADEGRVTFVPLEEDERYYYERRPRFPWFLGSLWRLMSAILGGALLLAIFPHLSDRVAAAARARPWPAIGWGALGIVILFACIGLMVFSILGIPLAMVLAVATPFLLFVAYILGAFGLSMIGARQIRRSVPVGWLPRLATLVAGLVALSIVGLVPILGGLVGFVTMLFGIGAAIMVWRDRGRAEAT
jgi:cytoskeletal protein CcmA (bactofilin family)